MRKIIRKLRKNEYGITGLETAIILIAFVVVASVFSYVVLSAGFLASDQAKGTVIDGLDKTCATLENRGSVIALDSADDDEDIDQVRFVISCAVSGEAVDITAPTDTTPDDGLADTNSSHKMVISYWDKYQKVSDLDWSASLITQYNDGDSNAISVGEEVLITVDLSYISGASGPHPLTANTNFVIEVKPAQGGVLTIERITPASIKDVNDLL